MMKRLAFFSFLILHFSFAFAYDFGLVLDQSASISGNGDETAFDYSGILVPRFSTHWGEEAEFSVSAGLQACYQNEQFWFVPELLRTELFLPLGGGTLTAGRMQYADPLGYIASGLFDGARFTYDTAFGSFALGGWYTGFLYRNRVNIAMTAKEQSLIGIKTDYSDFVDSYFAPRRLMLALDWEHMSLTELFMLNAALLAQFDLSGENLHSQYLAGKMAMPYRDFLFDAGLCFELIQTSGDSGLAFAAELGVIWALPLSLKSRLSFLARYAGGKSSSIYAFLPVTTESQGFVLRANHSGITLLSLDYALRLLPTCSLSLASSYFIRNDSYTYPSFIEDGKLLGNEFFARALWSPVSDLRLDFGAGVFLPSMGNAAPKAKNLWRMQLNAIISLY